MDILTDLMSELDHVPNHTAAQAKRARAVIYQWAVTTPGVRVADVVTIETALGFYDKGAA